MDTVVYVDEQKMPRLDCTDSHADLDLRCLHIALGSFSCVAHHLVGVNELNEKKFKFFILTG